ncbi:MAG: alkaline phosphatase family protein [Paludibacteraceae bacterium]|nr:alkaline phosphatase family protein [Paludibacteraceae bacterium]
MRTAYLYLALIAGSWLCTLPSRAELTVVVAVDGLDAASLQEMQPYWQQGGLRTLAEEAYYAPLVFNHWLYGGDESVATVMTGSYPAEHGICSNVVFSRSSRQVEDILLNTRKMGIGTTDSYSADALIAPTVTDRMRLDGNTSSAVYAVGIHPSTTIMLAGHAANACCWLGRNAADSVTWVSTSYYQEGLPAAADRMNIDGSLSHIVHRTWTPRMEMTAYNHPTASELKHPFSYACHQVLSVSPSANEAVIELALAIQKDGQLGQHAREDVLLLELTAITPNAAQARIQSAEQEDMYMRLNQDLGFLLEQLTKRLGNERLRLVLFGVPKLGTNATRLEQWNMPIRSFDLDRALALTSTYLMALYGHERWLDGGYGHSVYLNKSLIEQRQLSLETMRRQVAEFLMQFEGVSYACPVSEAFYRPDMVRSVHKRFAGDVLFTVQPNYMFLDDRLPVPAYIYPAPSAAPAAMPYLPATDFMSILRH